MRPDQRAPATPDTTVVDVAGNSTTVYGYGDPAGPVVLAVHGFRGTHIGLEPVARELADRGYRVLVPDLPATGASTPLTARHDIDGYAGWLVELSALLGAPPVLLGHSFGSVVVSAAVARGVPHRAVVLVNPIATDPLEASRRGAVAVTRAYYGLVRRLPARPARALLAHRLVAVLTSELMATSTDRDLRRWMRAEHVRQADLFAGRDPVLEAFAASTGATVRDFTDGYHAPTLLVAGERDDMGPVASQEALAARIPDSTLHVLPGVGHLVHFEATEAAADAVAGWLPGVLGTLA
ncbi:Hydrolase [Pseudonocardia sp. Ae168_Ps1]|uniref:alpha/beta fold hydrolase n=1 Tax=unclassified Pseudonocardia TaxID=2619320 RepID=UPI00094B5CC5|nr:MULTISPECIES: alpha/beta hydrolase [unclassified Pseudonocardia]OLL73774.1 Hydrolase [Pseudonocardia sp. Ae150A_Ps1]OLL79754.1 Hydrolase [Pseudonocardia sp. Ae168_Ps1]OLL86111.1 Hydrolase [Pseudonocardia sp. Ae263_Ps1]OLL93858.1 Hydrolase [Pseudonocardia sp. Ae356_Ps1]